MNVNAEQERSGDWQNHFPRPGLLCYRLPLSLAAAYNCTSHCPCSGSTIEFYSESSESTTAFTIERPQEMAVTCIAIDQVGTCIWRPVEARGIGQGASVTPSWS